MVDAINEVNENTDNIEIGGRNLILNSNVVLDISTPITGSDVQYREKNLDFLNIKYGDDYHEVLSETRNEVDLYKNNFVQVKAIQELDSKNKTLEERINQLEEIIKNML